MSHTDAPTDVARFEAYVRQVRFVTHAVSNAQDLLPDVPDVLTLQDLSVIRNDFVSPDSQQRYNVFTFANMNTGTRVQDRRSLIIKCVRTLVALLAHDDTPDMAPCITVIEADDTAGTPMRITCEAEAYVLFALEAEAHHVASVLVHGVLDKVVTLLYGTQDVQHVSTITVFAAEEHVVLRSTYLESHEPTRLIESTVDDTEWRTEAVTFGDAYRDFRLSTNANEIKESQRYYEEKRVLHDWSVYFCSRASWTPTHTLATTFETLSELCSHACDENIGNISPDTLGTLFFYYRGGNIVYDRVNDNDLEHFDCSDTWTFDAPFGPNATLCVQGQRHFDTVTKPYFEKQVNRLHHFAGRDPLSVFGSDTHSVQDVLEMFCKFGVGIIHILAQLSTRYAPEQVGLLWQILIVGYQYYNASVHHGFDDVLRVLLVWVDRELFHVSDRYSQSKSAEDYLRTCIEYACAFYEDYPRVVTSLAEQCAFAPHLSLACLLPNGVHLGRRSDAADSMSVHTLLQNAIRAGRHTDMYFGFCDLVRAREGLLGRLEDDPVWTAFLEDLTDEEACIVYPYVFRQLVPGVAEILERTHPLQRHQTALLAKANNSIFSLLTFNPRLDTSIFSAVASYIDDESVHACFITMLTHVDKHMHSVIERGRPPHHETLAPFGTTFAREDVLCHITQPERATLAGKLMFLPKVCCPTLFRTTVADWVPQDMFTVAEVLFGPTSSHTHTHNGRKDVVHDMFSNADPKRLIKEPVFWADKLCHVQQEFGVDLDTTYVEQIPHQSPVLVKDGFNHKTPPVCRQVKVRHNFQHSQITIERLAREHGILDQ